ncbi:MAG: GGDEF domain-containing protein [Proteobacteria bacterium]|nr:GGDEF domain-containing protein [Pseudomonadota bacterium]
MIFLDYATGVELSVSIFYLIPIAISTWYGGRRAGILFSLLSIISFFSVDIPERTYNSSIVLYWNLTTWIVFFLITEELINEIKIRLDNANYLSKLDSLTGLYNERGFTEQARKLFRLSVRHKRPISLAYLDLDNFKLVNDLQGHSEGDKVLQIVGERLLASVRVTDVVGRLGGDEFVVLLPETNEVGAETLFNTLWRNLVQEIQEHDWPVTVSIGVVSFDSPAMKLEEAIKLADILMYRVKKGGKNGILFETFPKKMSEVPSEPLSFSGADFPDLH